MRVNWVIWLQIFWDESEFIVSKSILKGKIERLHLSTDYTAHNIAILSIMWITLFSSFFLLMCGSF